VAPGGTAGVGQIDTIANIVATLQAQPDCYAVDATAYNSEFAKGRAHAYSLADTFSGPGVAGAMTLPTALPVASSCTSVPSTPGCVLFDETHMETDEIHGNRRDELGAGVVWGESGDGGKRTAAA